MKINPIGHLVKTNPIKANSRKAQMNVNSLITKDYRKNDAFAVQKNKPKTNPIFLRTKPMQPSLPQRIMKISHPARLEKTNPIKPNPLPPVIFSHKLNMVVRRIIAS